MRLNLTRSIKSIKTFTGMINIYQSIFITRQTNLYNEPNL